ncbi:hypothetical protein CsSME_00042694 [Camellia sinensis var. sinensis]
MARTEVVAPSAVAAYVLKDSSSWWDQIDESPLWQNRIFHVLAVLYGIVAAVAVVQLVRIQLRVPEYGWTTQKVFHFLNFVVNGVRSIVFIFRRDVQKLQPEILQHILLDMPSLAFFTTYALLVLFWAEIYYQARAVSTDGLRPSFYTINAVVYVVQVKILLHSSTSCNRKGEGWIGSLTCEQTMFLNRVSINLIIICFCSFNYFFFGFLSIYFSYKTMFRVTCD